MSESSFADALRQEGFAVPLGAELRPPRLLLHFGAALGDDLLCTAVLREWRRRNERDVWMMTRFPELFEGNDDADAIVSPHERLVEIVKRFGGKFVIPLYTRPDRVNDLGDPPPPAHIIAVMSHLAGITGRIAVRPYLKLREEEAAFGRFSSRQIAIQSSGLGAALPMKNKEWLPQRFQEVVDALKSEYTFVQIGSLTDPLLQGASDLRGKTTVRQSAAILRASMAFVGLVGFLMHLARAVGCRSVIVYGGRELPQQSGYSCNKNICNLLPCSPCWRWNNCGYEHACMMEIRSPAVIEAVKQITPLAGSPIADDVCDISPG
jgi:hypothetical protein